MGLEMPRCLSLSRLLSLVAVRALAVADLSAERVPVRDS
jgi:hypothetical protein